MPHILPNSLKLHQPGAVQHTSSQTLYGPCVCPWRVTKELGRLYSHTQKLRHWTRKGKTCSTWWPAIRYRGVSIVITRGVQMRELIWRKESSKEERVVANTSQTQKCGHLLYRNRQKGEAQKKYYQLSYASAWFNFPLTKALHGSVERHRSFLNVESWLKMMRCQFYIMLVIYNILSSTLLLPDPILTRRCNEMNGWMDRSAVEMNRGSEGIILALSFPSYIWHQRAANQAVVNPDFCGDDDSSYHHLHISIMTSGA